MTQISIYYYTILSSGCSRTDLNNVSNSDLLRYQSLVLSSVQYEYFNAVLINEVDEDGNSVELGGEFILEPDDHFNNLSVNLSLSVVQVPTNMYNKGDASWYLGIQNMWCYSPRLCSERSERIVIHLNGGGLEIHQLHRCHLCTWALGWAQKSPMCAMWQWRPDVLSKRAGVWLHILAIYLVFMMLKECTYWSKMYMVHCRFW